VKYDSVSDSTPKQGNKYPIAFHSADISFSLKERKALRRWLGDTAAIYGYSVSDLQYIFCSDDYLLQINQNFLNHDDYTDIITFDLGEKKGEICGEIYISIPRVKENGKAFGSGFRDELHRVMVHGVLHLCGLKDKTQKQEKEMRNAENEALLRRNF
jgi:rRNA maturation RNase YbeY